MKFKQEIYKGYKIKFKKQCGYIDAYMDNKIIAFGNTKQQALDRTKTIIDGWE